jgi:glycosyltransferase involved in cell wall biosynthesis
MKIAQVVCVYPPYAGGIGTSALQFAKTLATDHEVTTFTPVINSAPATEKDENVVRLKPFLQRGHGALLLQLFCRLNKYDAIYLHYPFFGTAEIVWLYKIFHRKTKLIIHYHMDVHGLGLFTKILSWPSKLIRNCLFNQAEKITCGSLDYIAHSQIAKYYNRHQNKFIEIPFGVDAERFKPADNKAETEIKKILFVGGLDQAHYFKGVNYLIDAVAKLSFSNWQLTITGDGNLKKQYEEQAKNLGLTAKVNFLGNKLNAEELARTYRAADLFVLPSINSNEAFGIVLLEAMASGVPVIASNLPGVRAVFHNEVEGLTIEPMNSNDLKEKMEKILTNNSLQKQMAQAARKLVEEKYSLEKVAGRLLAVFKN